MPMAYLVSSRWTRIPEDDIYSQLARLSVTWSENRVDIGDVPHYYLVGGPYAYPYSLPRPVIDRLAARLNRRPNMTWYHKYNQQAIDYYAVNGKAYNRARGYWEINAPDTPEPTIKTISEMTDILPDGLTPGTWYIAVIGLFHLTGEENGGNHHLYIDLIDLDGNRIYDHIPPLHLSYEWEGMRDEETPSPVRIDKPANEPGANIGISWGQVLRGFYINNVACEQFSGIHTMYPDSEPGNTLGHHSSYIVLQKRQWDVVTPPDPDPEPPDPEPEPEPPTTETIMTIKKDWLDKQPVKDGYYVIDLP